MNKFELLTKFFENIAEEFETLNYFENENAKNALLIKKIELIKYFLDNFDKWEE